MNSSTNSESGLRDRLIGFQHHMQNKPHNEWKIVGEILRGMEVRTNVKK